MSLPTAVFLDTSVLAGQQYNFGSSALASFIPVAKERSLVLLLPDPTEREWHRQIEERSREALDALDQARRRAPFLAKWEHFPKQVSQPRANWEVKRVAVRELKAFLGQFSLQRLSYDRVSLDEIMNWYDKCLPPFQVGKKRKEFPDAIAIAILAEHAKHSGIVVAVVSEDQDFKLACDRYQSLLYFRSLPALTELLVADPADIDRIRTAILADVSALDKAIAEEAGKLVVIHSDTEYTIDNSNVVSVSLSDVRVVAIGASDCTS